MNHEIEHDRNIRPSGIECRESLALDESRARGSGGIESLLMKGISAVLVVLTASIANAQGEPAFMLCLPSQPCKPFAYSG